MTGSHCDSPIKGGDGASSHSDQSSNLSECSQVLQYFNCSDGLSVSASLMGFGDGNQALANSANLSATSASSLTTGGNSLLSGNSTLQQNMSMKADSVTSTGAASMGLPTSPLSFSSSNVSLPGSSGFSMTSLSHSGVKPVSRLETLQDPTMHPSKLMKVDNGYQLMLNNGDSCKVGWQYNSNSLDATRQVLGTNAGGAFEHQFKGQGLVAARQDFHSSQQQLAQLQASMSAAKTLQKDFLQQQAVQNRLQRGNPLLSAQFHRHDVLQQQPSLLHPLQQRLLQQEQLLRTLPPHLQRSHVLQQQHQLQQHQQLQQQQQLQHQIAGLSKQHDKILPGSCSRRLMQYIHHQRMRPADNDIQFWREFTAEFFAPSSRKRWCLSQCSSGGRNQPSGIFPQELWCCELCGSSPSRGFEVAFEVIPRLCKSKFDNGELEDLLFVDFPHEYRLNSGHIVLEYKKAVQESVYEQLRVVWEGQLKVVFTPELKILSWDFCAKSHEELLPRRSIVPQVNQLVALASKYQSMAHSNGNGPSVQELQAVCKVFVACAHQLANSLEPPCVNELGFTKRFVRCIQIAEVVNSMKDLIDFGRNNNLGPIESLAKFPGSRSTLAVIGPTGQNEAMGLDRPGTEENTSYSFLHPKIEDQGNIIGQPLSEHANLMQTRLLQHGTGSQQNFLYGDISGVGTPNASFNSASNLLQASPTSSLNSYQTGFSSLANSAQPLVTSLQNPFAGNSGTVNLLQRPSFQQNLLTIDPISGAPVQQFFHGMINSQPRPGPASGQKNNGSSGIKMRNTEGMLASSLPRSLPGLDNSISSGSANTGGTGPTSENRQQYL
ncbi:hypothetical protein L7F22_035024 [Adiantum nelumboides]|nr:hypothetical protein [Adiantum nelumboides]